MEKFLKNVRNEKNLNSFKIDIGGNFAVDFVFFQCPFSTYIKILQKKKIFEIR